MNQTAGNVTIRVGSWPTTGGRRLTDVGVTIRTRTRRCASPTSRPTVPCRRRPAHLSRAEDQRAPVSTRGRSRRPSANRSWIWAMERRASWLTSPKDGACLSRFVTLDHHYLSLLSLLAKASAELYRWDRTRKAEREVSLCRENTNRLSIHKQKDSGRMDHFLHGG